MLPPRHGSNHVGANGAPWLQASHPCFKHFLFFVCPL